MVDYAKWDKMDYGSSDEDEGSCTRMPRVTRVEDSTIMLPGASGGDSIQITPSKQQLQQGGASAATSVGASSSSSGGLGGMENGARCADYRWGQTAVDVTLVVPVPAHVRCKDVVMQVSGDHLNVSVDGRVVEGVGGDWWGGVEFESEEDSVDWTLEDDCGGDGSSSGRALRVVVRKASPIAGAVQWWAAAFKGEAEVNTTTLPGRGLRMASGNKQVGGQGAQDAWMEAQRLFALKVQEQRAQDPVVVDLEDSDSDCC